MKLKFTLIAIIFLFISSAFAQFPPVINYQGRLLNEENKPITQSINVVFSIYDNETNGNLLWTETHNLQPNDGYINVFLGSKNPIQYENTVTDLWLEISIGGDPVGSRTQFTAVPWAFYASTADTAKYALTQLGEYEFSGVLETDEKKNIEFKIAGSDVAVYIPGDTAASIKQGYGGNIIDAGVEGSSILGGGRPEANNRIAGNYSTIAGGCANVIGDTLIKPSAGKKDSPQSDNNIAMVSSFIGAGQDNKVTAPLSAIMSGSRNSVLKNPHTKKGMRNTIATGYYNTIYGARQAFIGGGRANHAGGLGSSILTGFNNSCSGYYASILNGYYNSAQGIRSLAGGSFAFARHDYGIVFNATADSGAYDTEKIFSTKKPSQFLVKADSGIGFNTNITPEVLNVNGAIVIGANNEENAGTLRFIEGEFEGFTGEEWVSLGSLPKWTDDGDVIRSAYDRGIARYQNKTWGGQANTHINLAVAGVTGSDGFNHQFCTVGGGSLNQAGGDKSTVTGGVLNHAEGEGSFVGGGSANVASGQFATIGGGEGNNTQAIHSAIIGGSQNEAFGFYTVAAGGLKNNASGSYAAVLGGEQNKASGDNSVVGGGWKNEAAGIKSAIPGGTALKIGDNSFGFKGGLGSPMVLTDLTAQTNSFHVVDAHFVFNANREDADFTVNGTIENLLFADASTNRIGIGISEPATKLDIDGAVKVGQSNSDSQGAIRYQDGKFEGRTGSGWTQLDNSGGGTKSGTLVMSYKVVDDISNLSSTDASVIKYTDSSDDSIEPTDLPSGENGQLLVLHNATGAVIYYDNSAYSCTDGKVFQFIYSDGWRMLTNY
jgi:hypothetical protein